MSLDPRPVTKMTDLFKKVNDKLQTKLNFTQHRFHGFLKLPIEIQNIIIQYAIPEFIPTIDIAYKHRCHQSLDKKPLRWKVSGIPKTALNLQLVNRQVYFQTREYMQKACGGLRSISYPLSCDCSAVYDGLFKHTQVIYLLHDAFRDMPVDPTLWSRNLSVLHRCLRNTIALRGWRIILNIKDDLYLSNYSRDWNMAIVLDRILPIVVERWGTTWEEQEWSGPRGLTIHSRLALMMELNIRFLAPKQIKIDPSKTPPVLAKFIGKKQLVPERSRASDGVVKRALFKLKRL